MTREEWLIECVHELRHEFDVAGFSLPEKIRASCSWPSRGALSVKKTSLGEAWSSENSGDEHFEIFISPKLFEPAIVGATLVHELCHCAVGLKAKHGKKFALCATRMGLEGKMTATTAGETLQCIILRIAEKIGPYPHAELKSFAEVKTQTTRYLKVTCGNCGCVVRMTKKWIETVGTPVCGCGGEMEQEEQEDEE